MSIKPFLRRIANAALALPGLHALARLAGRAGLLPERLWAGFPLEGVKQLAIAGVMIRYRVSPGDHVGMPLYWCGARGYEPETLERFANFLGDAEVFYDIGANTGLFTLLAGALRPQLRIIAMEPNPETAKRLRENIALNGLDARVTVIEAALAPVAGEATFDIPDATFALSSTLADSASDVPAHTRRIRVRAITPADLMAISGPVQAIKLDCEGVEADILEAASAWLATRPRLLIEVLDDAPFTRLEAALAPHGYRFARMGEGPLTYGTRLGPRGANEGRNVLAIAE